MPTTRSAPPAPRITIDAPTAAQTADRSSDGSAWQSAPPIVPRLRTTGSAITRSASVKIASRCASSSDSSSARWRVSAPIRTSSAVRLDVAELVGERVDVDHVRRRGEAELHHRQQRVAPGEQPRLRAELGEQHQRVLDARRALVAERCRDLQDRLLLALLDTHIAGVMVALSNRT